MLEECDKILLECFINLIGVVIWKEKITFLGMNILWELRFCRLGEVNPIPVKAALNMLGYNVGIPRLPLIEMSESGKIKMEKELKKFGLIK